VLEDPALGTRGSGRRELWHARDVWSYGLGNLPPELASYSTMRIFCKADEEYSITATDGMVCLAPSDPSDDYRVRMVLMKGHLPIYLCC
jgi:hypothetical protein